MFCCLIFWLAQSFRLIRILPVIAPPPISSYCFLQSPKKDSLPMFSKMLFSGLKIVQCFLASAWSSQRPSFAPLHEIPLNPPLANRRVQKKEQHEQKANKQSKKANKPHFRHQSLGNFDNQIVNIQPTADQPLGAEKRATWAKANKATFSTPISVNFKTWMEGERIN